MQPSMMSKIQMRWLQKFQKKLASLKEDLEIKLESACNKFQLSFLDLV